MCIRDRAHKFACRYDFTKFLRGIAANCLYYAVMLFFAVREYQNWTLALWKIGYFVLLGFLCYFLFEIAEYMEHYGLICRQKDG